MNIENFKKQFSSLPIENKKQTLGNVTSDKDKFLNLKFKDGETRPDVMQQLIDWMEGEVKE